jgi:hypothetical protein
MPKSTSHIRNSSDFPDCYYLASRDLCEPSRISYRINLAPRKPLKATISIEVCRGPFHIQNLMKYAS